VRVIHRERARKGERKSKCMVSICTHTHTYTHTQGTDEEVKQRFKEKVMLHDHDFTLLYFSS